MTTTSTWPSLEAGVGGLLVLRRPLNTALRLVTWLYSGGLACAKEAAKHGAKVSDLVIQWGACLC